MAQVVKNYNIDRNDEVVGSGANTAARIVYTIGGLIMALLGLRFLLTLLGANPNNAFANFIYSTSNPFARPFFGLFNYNPTLGQSRLEVETLVAIAVYGLITWFIVRLLTVSRRSTEI